MKRELNKVLNTLGVVLLVLLIGAAYSQTLKGGGESAQAVFARKTPRVTEVPQMPQASSPPSAPKYLVVVDAGHGGEDGGAVGVKGTVEAGINLAVALCLKAELEASGISVLLTREDEHALADSKRGDMLARKEAMNTEGVDLVVSIHMNSFKDRSVHGPMAFYMKGSEEGKLLAQKVIDNVCTAIEHPLRSANPGDYFMIRESPAPSVLVECGFLSNAKDEALLNDPAHQQKLAHAIALGVMEYLSIQG